MKFAIWLAIAGVVVYLIQRWKQAAVKSSLSKKAPGPLESMAQCRHCGIYLPVSESIIGPASEKFCSEEHLRLHGGGPE